MKVPQGYFPSNRPSLIGWGDPWPAKFFTQHELKCKGSGALWMDPDFLQMLDELRAAMGKPLTVTSGYRSRQHNLAVGGARGSYHTRGRACDLSTSDEKFARDLLGAACALGFGGIGVYRTFIHVDNGPRRIWGRS